MEVMQYGLFEYTPYIALILDTFIFYEMIKHLNYKALD